MKKAGLLLLALSVVGFSNIASAKVVLNIPQNVDLLAVNGKTPEKAKGLFPSDTEELKDGVTQIVFQYIPTFTVHKSDLRKAYSDVYVAKIKASDTSLTFKLPEYRSFNQARQDITNMTWSLMDDNDHNVVIAKDKLEKDGVQFGRDYVAEVARYNQGMGPAVLSSGAVVLSQNENSASDRSQQNSDASTSSKPNANVTNLQQLKLWYKKSSAQERKAFRKWIIDQE
ncbi:DUF2057 family protein [Vibrio palustris]|uniref:UPF0319 protein VPAL9027_00842 n=1 Tax=Vibrio palustris TaxID=1918946 RepID=A0A1R4B1W7_9VIBR|nr:DUF2057 family protein [Vibrio palustris]SJL82901.1 hypothetical protein VPAL9027_00842 [Vibrio palustris]